MGNRLRWKRDAGKNYAITHDIATHRPLHSPRPTKITVRLGEAPPQHNADGATYDIMATKTGPHAVSTILPMA